MHDVPITVGFMLAATVAFGLSLLPLGIGVLWSPFAAVMCYNRAALAGLNSTRYAVVGALYSVLFLMPLIYLSARMDGKRVPKALVVLGYVVLYGGIWLGGAIAGLAASFSFSFNFGFGGGSGLANGIAIALLCINALSMIVSLAILAQAPEDSMDKGYRETLPPFAYILPFALAFGWTAVTAAMLLLG